MFKIPATVKFGSCKSSENDQFKILIRLPTFHLGSKMERIQCDWLVSKARILLTERK